MAMTTNPGAARQTVTAFFESPADADKAKADLLAAGFNEDAIALASGVDHAAASPSSGQSVIKSLLEIFVFMPPHEKPTFEEALRRGGVALSVETDAAHYERAIDILDRDGAIDLDERQEAWKAEGWQAQAEPRPGGPGSPSQAAFEAQNSHDPLVNPNANRDMRERIGVGTADMTAATDVDPPSAVKGSGAAAPAKRDLAHGRTRVRSYIHVPDGIDPQI